MRVAWVTQSEVTPVTNLIKELCKSIEVRRFVVSGKRVRGLIYPSKEKLREMIDTYHPDVIVADEPYQPSTSICREYCSLFKVPLIVTVRRNNASGIFEEVFFCLQSDEMLKNMKCAEKVVSVSTRGVEWIGRYCIELTPDEGELGGVVVIPNGVDLDAFKCNGISKPHLILNVCRNHPDKRLDLTMDVYCKVARRMEGVKMVLMGVGADVGLFANVPMKMRKDVYRDVSVLGSIPYAQMSEVYGMAEVVISTSRKEPFGMSILEAMACGKPVVAFDVGGHSDLIKNGVNGYLIPFGNTDAFADAVGHLLGDQVLRTRMGLEGRCIAERKFQLKDVADKWIKLLKEVCG